MDSPALDDSVTAAKELLGWELIFHGPSGEVGGRVVETEAYHQDDEASHSFGGQRVRNAALFGPSSTVYIYFTYGMHYCLNIVTGPVGSGQGVLIRALEPTLGIDLMQQNRHGRSGNELTNGPAKLVQALGIPPEYNGRTLAKASIELRPGKKPTHIISAPRIGISKAADKLLRFYDADSLYVSKH